MKQPDTGLGGLGLDVVMEQEKIQADPGQKSLLQKLGNTHLASAGPGMTYAGSFVTHIYASEFGQRIAYIHQHTFPAPVGEKIVSNAVSDLALHLMTAVFGRRKPATRNSKDKRGLA